MISMLQEHPTLRRNSSTSWSRMTPPSNLTSQYVVKIITNTFTSLSFIDEPLVANIRRHLTSIQALLES